MPDKQLIVHDIPPVFAANSRVLLLGSLPSPKSRAQGFFYGHPQNRFWPTLAAVLNEPVPARDNIAAKKAMLLKHRLALWPAVRLPAPQMLLSVSHSQTILPACWRKRKFRPYSVPAPKHTACIRNFVCHKPVCRRRCCPQPARPTAAGATPSYKPPIKRY